MGSFDRASRLAGPGAALLLLLAGIFANAGGAPSPYRAPGSELVEHYARNGTNLDAAALLNLFAALLLVAFAAGMWWRFCEAPDPGARGWSLAGLLGGGGLAVVTMLVAAAQTVLAGLAGIDGAEADTVRAAAVVVAASMQVAALAAVPMLAGFGVAGLRYPAHARWLAWVAVVGAASGVLGVLPDVAAAMSVTLADLLGLLGQVEMPLLVIWLIGAGFSGGPEGDPGEPEGEG